MNLEEQLSSVLSNPDAMSKISSIIGALGNQAPQQSAPQQAAPQQPAPEGVQGIALPDLSDDNRTKLIMALKPFLSEKRAPYVEGAIALLRMMQLGKLGKSLKLF